MRPTIIAMTAAVLAAGALATPANAAPSYQTEVVLDGVYPHDNGGTLIDFYGTVSAERPFKCARDRFIQVFLAQVGPDVEIGSTRSDSGAFWSLTRDGGEVQGGEYYAKAPKRTLANGAVCLADRSAYLML